jgi:hypothetical protein
MPIRCLASSAAVLAALLATGCHEDPAPAPIERCPAADADRPALEAWLAQPLKTCSLEAVFPHRAPYASGQALEKITGWDRELLLADADDNGAISFGDDGRSFAVLRDLSAPRRRSYEQVFEPDGACVDSDALAFTATVVLADGVCTVSLAGDEAYTRPLHGTVNVALASWPGMPQERWQASGPANRPALGDGFEYVEAPIMANLVAYTRAPHRFTVLAGWLGVDAEAAQAHMTMVPDLSWRLTTVAIDGRAPYVWPSAGATVATHDEAWLLAARPLPWTLHTNAGTAQDSRFEVALSELRYLGAEARDDADAARDGVACVRALLERDLAAHAASRYSSPAQSPYERCDALTVDLAAAVAGDAEALALAVGLYSDAARERHGVQHADRPLGYAIGSLFVQEVVAAAMAAGVDAGRGPSLMLSRALESWHVLAAVVAAHRGLGREIAAAAIERAETDVILLAQGVAGRAPLVASDAARIGAALAAAQGDEPAVREVLQAIAYDVSPVGSSL